MPVLEKSDTKVANSAGKAICQVQPLRAFEKWHITNTAVSSNSTVVPTVKLYRNSESPSGFIDGSYVGSFNQTADPIDLENGERLLAVFEGCDVGSSCSLTVTGETRGRF